MEAVTTGGAHPLGGGAGDEAVRALPPPPAPAPALATGNAVELFLGQALHWRKPTDASVAQSLDGIAELASCGAWHAVAKLAERLLPTAHPELALALRQHRITALLRVRNYRAASDELAALGDLDAPALSYEAHAELYPGRHGARAASPPRSMPSACPTPPRAHSSPRPPRLQVSRAGSARVRAGRALPRAAEVARAMRRRVGRGVPAVASRPVVPSGSAAPTRAPPSTSPFSSLRPARY